MRMLALAQWIVDDGGQVTLASVRLSPQLEELVRRNGIAIARAEVALGSHDDGVWTRALFSAGAFDWLVSDGYHFADAYQSAMQQHGIRQVVFDDYGHCQKYVAEIVVNQNASATETMYAGRAAQTDLLLGTRYAVLRREFVRALPLKRSVPDRADHVLVTLGGADPLNTTASVAAWLLAISDPALRVRIVIGPSNPRADELRRNLRDDRVELLSTSEDMAAQMVWAHLALAGAGTTTWELAYMGVPTILIVLADNQEALARSMAEAGACANLGWHHSLREATTTLVVQKLRADAKARARMAALGQSMVDGQGGRRILDAIRDRMVRSATVDTAQGNRA
jgi:UDP-2,4-diacetamido-2,4,6-trideoxy-beta-L-altropyranose hydrolase